MAKSLRSNKQKALRRARAQAMKCTWQEEADKRRQEALAKSVASTPEPVPEKIVSDPEQAESAMVEERGRVRGSGKTSGSARIKSAEKNEDKEGEDAGVGKKEEEDVMELDEALNSRIQEKLHKLKGVQKKKRVGERKRQVGALHAFEAAQKDSKGRKKRGRKTLDEIRYML